MSQEQRALAAFSDEALDHELKVRAHERFLAKLVDCSKCGSKIYLEPGEFGSVWRHWPSHNVSCRLDRATP